MTPLMAMMLNIPLRQWPPLLIALLIGSMGLTLLGVIGAALAEGARRGTALMALLILPLAVPLLIFGTLASQSDRGIISPHLMLLGRRFCVAFGLGTAGRGKRLGNWRNRDRSLTVMNAFIQQLSIFSPPEKQDISCHYV
jgi:predicted permease